MSQRDTAYKRLLDDLRNDGRVVNDDGSGHAKTQCPAHNDNNPSLSITAIEGQVLVHCHAGCKTEAIMAALGRSMADLYDTRNGAHYRYSDGRTVHRRLNKTFPQSGNTAGRALYHVETISEATTTVYVPEGEKDVHAIESVGGSAVCSAMGAGKAHLFDWSPLKGKHVVIVADKDDPGRKHAQQVTELVGGIAASVKVVEAKTGKDSADHVAAGHGLDEFVEADGMVELVEDGSILLDDLRDVITTYVVLPDSHAVNAVTLWAAATHALPASECAPRLVITSPDKRCGKSRLLDILGGTCHRPLATVNATVAAIFRSIGCDHPPTLIIDEADTIFGSKRVAEQHEDLRALLNAGHQRGRPALRCVGPQQTPTEFPTFAMAALAGIGSMPDTITDRAISITMRRRTAAEKVSQFRSRRDGPVLQEMRDRLAAWAAAHVDELSKAEPEMPVEDRAADTWELLIAIADAAGGHWPTTARAACVALVTAAGEADQDHSLAVKLLSDIREIFRFRGAPFLASADLVAELRKVEDSPWKDFDINPSKLAYRLKDFGIKPQRNTVGSIRGYTLEALSDVFRRYLRQDPSDRQETNSDQQIPPDALNASDTLARQAESTRQIEPAAQDIFLTPLTASDGGTAGTATKAAYTGCAGCGEHLTSAESIAAGYCLECRMSKSVRDGIGGQKLN